MRKQEVDKLNLSSFNKETLSFLTKGSKEEEDRFIEEYWTGEEEDQFEDILKLRLDKQKTLNLSYPAFLQLYSKNHIEALEALFQHPISKSDYEVFAKRLEERGKTLADIYSKHKKHPDYLLLRMVL